MCFTDGVNRGLIWLFAVAGIALLFGCADQPKNPATPPSPPQIVVPRGGATGRVQLVTEFRFVVLDFSGALPPPSGAILDVMRGGRKVGRVQTDAVSREFPTMVTADIIEGEARKGDYVRFEPPQRTVPNAGTASPERPPSNIQPRRRSR